MRAKVSVSGGGNLSAYIDKMKKQTRDGKTLDVGFLEDATYPDGTPVAAVAFWNEYGTMRNGERHSSPRPFMRQTIAEHSDQWGGNLKRALEANDGDIDKALGTMGEGIKGQIQEAINEFEDPPNATSTVIKKGFNKPLIDTGHMRDSVDYRVSDKND